MALVRIIERDQYAIIRTTHTLNATLTKHTGGYLDRDEGGILIPLHTVEQTAVWLQEHGHTVIQHITPDPRVCPHGVTFGARLDDHGISTGGCNRCEQT